MISPRRRLMPITRAEVFIDTYPLAAEVREGVEPVGAHTHDFLELVVVITGTAIHTTPQGAENIRTGHVLVVRPGSWHAISNPVDLAVANLYLGEELLADDLAWLLTLPHLGPLFVSGGELALDPAAATALLPWVHRLDNAPSDGSLATRVQRRSLLGCAIAELCRGAEDATSRLRREIAVVLTTVTERLNEDWTVPSMACVASLSASHFQREFRLALGVSPMRWLAELRAERLGLALITTREPTAALARAVGWPDPNYASRRFRQLRGMSPRDFRARFGRA